MKSRTILIGMAVLRSFTARFARFALMPRSHRRIRFSLRTLLALVTLAGGYLACWRPTTRHGPRDVWNAGHIPTHIIVGNVERPAPPRAVAPLLIAVDDTTFFEPRRRYYFWFFGYVAKLPYENTLAIPFPEDEPLDYPLDEDWGRVKRERLRERGRLETVPTS